MHRNILFASAWAIAFPLAFIDFAQAKGGRFLGSLVGGAGKAIVRGGAGSVAKNYGSNVLTVDQLKSCLSKALKLDEESEALTAAHARLSTVKTMIDTAETELDQRKNNLNRSRKSEVDRFNQDVGTHNAQLRRAKAEQSDYNARVDNHNVSIADYNGNCVKSYYRDDMDVAKAALKLD